ncbi:MAG TPA: HupE/UreJ family protein [Tepidisphaeraceae bacterium]
MTQRFRLFYPGSVALLCASLLLACLAHRAAAHPISQGSLDVTLHPDHVAVRARVTVEEVTVTNRLTTPGATPDPFAAMDSAAYEQHAAYLASHVQVIVNGQSLPGGVARVDPPDAAQPGPGDMATYELLYPVPAHTTPHTLELRTNALTESGASPALKWEASYVVRVTAPGRAPIEALLLTPAHPINVSLDASPGSAEARRAAGPFFARLDLFGEYFVHGIHHIFSTTDPGYDHLLFVSALVLGARTLWGLFKLVTAFTLAHTITLTLAALNLVHVPERIVEPLIALSICFVAIENVFFPDRSGGWLRLGVAFFFGLFHGLGFAGGLLQAMQGMSGAVVLIAILAFSLGVETAHQMVVLPLFALLQLARATRRDDKGRQAVSLVAQRFGSVAISLAGLLYLFLALRLSFTGME